MGCHGLQIFQQIFQSAAFWISFLQKAGDKPHFPPPFHQGKTENDFGTSWSFVLAPCAKMSCRRAKTTSSGTRPLRKLRDRWLVAAWTSLEALQQSHLFWDVLAFQPRAVCTFYEFLLPRTVSKIIASKIQLDEEGSSVAPTLAFI